MYLNIIDWQYRKGSGASLQQGVKGGRVPKHAVRGGNGSYIVSPPPQVIVELQDNDTGETCTVDIYHCLKSQLMDVGYRMSEKSAKKMLRSYREQQPFLAEDWGDWYPLPNLSSLLG